MFEFERVQKNYLFRVFFESKRNFGIAELHTKLIYSNGAIIVFLNSSEKKEGW